MGRSLIGWVGGAFVAVVVCGGNGVAQPSPYPTYDIGGVTRYERDVVEADRDNPGNSQGAFSFLDETSKFSAPVGRNPNLWCPPGNATCNENSPPPTPGPIVRKSSINTFSPMTGMGTVMSSMAYANQAAALLVSPLSILKIAWGLTEPAIASGNEAAMTQASLAMLNRYASDDAYLRHARLNPQSEIILQAYRDCISRAMGVIEPGAMGPPAPGASWIEAVSKCQGGDSIVSTSTTPFANPEPDGFVLANHNAHGQAGSTLPGAANLPYEISALDLVFNPVLHSGSWSADELQSIRESFMKLVGDVTLAVGSGFSGARGIETTRIPPQEPSETTYKKLALEAYHSLNELMWRECKQKLRDESVAGATSERVLLERLSVSGFSLGKRGKDSFFQVYKKRVAAQLAPQCDDLRSWESSRPTSLERLSQGGFWFSRTTEMTRIYFAFARGIAMARYLGSLKLAESITLQLSGGEVETMMRRAVLDAIYEVAGTSNLDGAYDANLTYLRQLEAGVIQAGQASNKDFDFKSMK